MSASAEVFNIFTEDLSAFDVKIESDGLPTFNIGNDVVPPVTVFNDGVGLLNGMEFTLTKSAGIFDPALGLGQFGLFGSSDADTGPDYLFDNIRLESIAAEATEVPFTSASFTNVIELTVESEPGILYELETTTDLTAPNWTGVGYQILGDGGPQAAYDVDGGKPHAEYRIRGRGRD